MAAQQRGGQGQGCSNIEEGCKILQPLSTSSTRHQGRITCSNPTSIHKAVGYIWGSHLCRTTSPVLCKDQIRGSVEVQQEVYVLESSSIHTAMGKEHRIDTSTYHYPKPHTTTHPRKIRMAMEAHSMANRRSFMELTIIVITAYKLFPSAIA